MARLSIPQLLFKAIGSQTIQGSIVNQSYTSVARILFRSPERIFEYSHFHNRTPLSLRFSASELTLSRFAGGEYLPLPASKGPAFPSPSASLRTSSAHPRWVPHLSSNLRSGTKVFSKNSGNTRGLNIGFTTVSLR